VIGAAFGEDEATELLEVGVGAVVEDSTELVRDRLLTDSTHVDGTAVEAILRPILLTFFTGMAKLFVWTRFETPGSMKVA